MVADSKPTEQPWLTQGAQKRLAVRDMFDGIAKVYDRNNALMSLWLDGRWRSKAVSFLNLNPGDVAIDLCTGTGRFLAPLRNRVKSKGEVLGIDFSPNMLTEAKRNQSPGDLALGDANQIPLRSNVADAVTIGWGLRNVSDIDLAHKEILRILKPGGRFVSIDMAVPQNRAMRALVMGSLRVALPLLGRATGNRQAYSYLPESALRFWNRQRLASSMSEAGFTEIRWRDVALGALCIHYGRKPLTNP